MNSLKVFQLSSITLQHNYTLKLLKLVSSMKAS